MSKFASLSLGIDRSVRMFIKNPMTQEVIVDAATNEQAYIDVLPQAGTIGRSFDRATLNRQMENPAKTIDPVDQYSEKLASVTTGWRLIGADGVALNIEFSPDAARELYAEEAAAWIRDQVAAFTANLGNWRPPQSGG